MKKIVFLIYICFFVACQSYNSNQKSDNNDLGKVEIRIDSLINLSEQYFASTEFNDSLFDEHLQNAYGLANDFELHEQRLAIYNKVGKRYRNISNFGVALHFYKSALEIANQMEDDRLKAYTKAEMAVVFRRIADNGKALSLHFQALEWAESAGDTSLILKSNNGIGNVYFSYKNLPKAIVYFKKSLHLLSNGYPNKLSEAINTNNIGEAWLALGNTDSALYYIGLSYAINIEMNSKIGQAICENALGDIYLSLKDYDKAIKHYNNSVRFNKEVGNGIYLAGNYKSLGKTYFLINNSSLAEKYLLDGLKISKEIGSKSHIVDIQTSLSQLYQKKGEHDKAIDYLSKAMVYKDTITEEVSRLNSDGLSALYKTEKQEREIEYLEQKDKLNQLILNRQKWFILSGILIILGGLIFSIYAVYQRKMTARYTSKIQEQNQNIRDSIRYAQKIQSAVLPDLESLKNDIDEYFVLYKPRDIVSGDFYWQTKIGNSTIVVTSDCTGHGVPGALMSMLGIAFLNEIVNKEGLTEPNLILDRLRDQVILQLKQKGNFEDSKDGMDLSIYVINHDTMKLTFAAANSPLYIIRSGELIHLKGDTMPIGYHPKKMDAFSSREFHLQKGDCLYSCTDGYHDQFGGIDGTKFMIRNFKNLLIEIHSKPMQVQVVILDQKFMEWRGFRDQLDDIIVMGVRI
ncbi:MAG: tetratricopeptide repeat protein [Salinivirgaceae bacterium]|nr:tetratricopeptide repeat protein [Salinivirgaceae bacterium]